ncbi:MAG: hypothetical protein WCK73_05820 [Deltaproteobacteria bacterium]
MPAPVPAPRPVEDPVEVATERIRHIPGVKVVWWYGSGPYFACARHLGEPHITSGQTLLDALVQLEYELRDRNRITLREAVRLE